MKNERFEELMGLFLDGEIAATQLDELTELVAADPMRLKELRGQLAMGARETLPWSRRQPEPRRPQAIYPASTGRCGQA